MNFTIEPYKSVGPLRFGMEYDEMVDLIGEPSRKLVRFPKHDESFEAIYNEVQMYVEFDTASSKLRMVQFVSPASVMFRDADIMKLSYRDLKAFLLELNPQTEEDEPGSLTSYQFGIASYYTDSADEPDMPVEAIGVFCFGYYE